MIHTRTYNARRGRMRIGRLDTMARLLPVYAVPEGEGPIDRAALFGRSAPLVLEIGSGMGETTVAMAIADPDRDYLAVEVHTAGVANLLRLVEAAGVDNVRLVHGDAVALRAGPSRPGQSRRDPRLLSRPVAQGTPPQAATHPACACPVARGPAGGGRRAALRHRRARVRRADARGAHRRATCSPTSTWIRAPPGAPARTPATSSVACSPGASRSISSSGAPREPRRRPGPPAAAGSGRGL